MAIYCRIMVYAALLLYVCAAISYFAAAKGSRASHSAFVLSSAGLVFNLLAIVFRTIISGRLPLASGYEFILCFTCITVLAYLTYEVINGIGSSGGPVMLIASLLLISVLVLEHGQLGGSSPLTPALKSPWLAIHVLTAAAAYSGFTLAAGLAFVKLRKTLPSEDGIVYRIVSISFALLSLSIVFGAIWAEQAWGSYWSWDPKETWALVTWIVYAAYLHLYRQKDWRGRPANILVIAGFIIVLFTFFGVNFLMSGMHSYS